MKTHRIIQTDRWKPDESAASAYLRANKIILQGSCITSIGDFSCEPCRVLSATAPDSEVGAALLDVLAAAKIVQPPIDMTLAEQTLFASAGVRSWKQLHKGAINCYTWMAPKLITILPTRNEGRTFFHVPSQAIKLPTDSMPEQFGRALREGFLRGT